MKAFLALICTLGLACMGPAAAHAGGQRKQQQSRGRPYAGQAPAGYHGSVGGGYRFNASTNKSVPRGVSAQRGVQVVRPNTNLPYQFYIRPSRTGTGSKTTDGATRTAGTGIAAPPTPLPTPVPSDRPSTTGRGSKTTDGATETAGTGIAPAEQFQQNRRILGSDRWEGSNYQTLRNYKSEWHDRNWWRSHHSRIVFGAGGWYYWNAGYWFPAWGYDPGAHYAYDGPIYAYNDLPPDRVVANAQAALRPQGYYQAEPDGLLGSHTRAAIVNYQRDHGLYETSTIDRPTSQSLGMK
jgi:putative peptidoglycan binding protein